MKKGMYVMVLLLLAGMVGYAQPAGFKVDGIGSVSIPVSLNKMTNLIFPESILVAVKVSRDLIAQKVRGVNNVLELKAGREGMAETNLSVYGVGGRVYSFTVHFSGDSAVLNYQVIDAAGRPGRDTAAMIQPSGLPANELQLRADARRMDGRRPFLRKRRRSDGLVLRLRGVFLADSLEWLALQLNNRTRIPFQPTVIRYYLEDKKQVKRRASQQEPLEPVYTEAVPLLAGLDMRNYAVGFKPFTVPKGKRLVVALSGEDGGRMVVMTIRSGLVMKAR
jgi:hypothetical protein